MALTRPARLSGLFVQYETRLNPTESRPIPDAVVIMQVGGDFNRTDIVPWSRDPAIEDEHRWRFAIEADNQSEPLAVIRGKAVAYAHVQHDPAWQQWWRQHFGPLPIPIWVVSNKDDDPEQAMKRLQAIHTAWEQAWSKGQWLGVTEANLKDGEWLWYAERRMTWRTMTTFMPPIRPNHSTGGGAAEPRERTPMRTQHTGQLPDVPLMHMTALLDRRLKLIETPAEKLQAILERTYPYVAVADDVRPQFRKEMHEDEEQPVVGSVAGSFHTIAPQPEQHESSGNNGPPGVQWVLHSNNRRKR